MCRFLHNVKEGVLHDESCHVQKLIIMEQVSIIVVVHA